MLARPTVMGGSVSERPGGPGDVLASGQVINALTTAGAGTWTAAMIAGGIIQRTGPGAGYTDTTDTADAILRALGGNDYALNVLPGTSFELLFRNTVAFAMTFAAGRGVIAGSGTLDCAASVIRRYLVEILNSTPETVQNATTTNASAVVSLTNPVPAGTITPGMVVSGAGITAGTRVAGVTYGNSSTRADTDKITGVTLDQNATASATNNLTFSPCIRFHGIGSMSTP